MLDQYPVLDGMSFANWRIGLRTSTHYITVHYNGPRVKAFGNPWGELQQLRSVSKYHQVAPRLLADGIQYHIGVISDGKIYKLRALMDKLWHAGNHEANNHSIAIHLPLGGDQQPTAAQINALYTLCDQLCAVYNLNACAVRLHSEWKPTECPGPHIANAIHAYRTSRMPRSVDWYRTSMNANIRQSPDVVNGPIVATLPPQTIIPVAELVTGRSFRGSDQYIRLADNRGFMHVSIVQPYIAGLYGI